MLSRAVVVTMTGSFSALAALSKQKEVHYSLPFGLGLPVSHFRGLPSNVVLPSRNLLVLFPFDAKKTGWPGTYRFEEADSDLRSGTDDDLVYINFSRLKGHHVMLQLAGGIVPDTRHEADLMIDEDEGCIFGSEGIIRVGLTAHCILLYVFE
jgi:hypothetical protein